MLGWFVGPPGDCLQWPWRTKLSPLDQNTPVKYPSKMHFCSNLVPVAVIFLLCCLGLQPAEPASSTHVNDMPWQHQTKFSQHQRLLVPWSSRAGTCLIIGNSPADSPLKVQLNVCMPLKPGHLRPLQLGDIL